MELFNIICGVCSIAGLLVSVFTAGKVVKINQAFQNNSPIRTEIIDSTIHGSSAGRDIINGTGNSK